MLRHEQGVSGYEKDFERLRLLVRNRRRRAQRHALAVRADAEPLVRLDPFGEGIGDRVLGHEVSRNVLQRFRDGAGRHDVEAPSAGLFRAVAQDLFSPSLVADCPQRRIPTVARGAERDRIQDRAALAQPG